MWKVKEIVITCRGVKKKNQYAIKDEKKSNDRKGKNQTIQPTR